MMVRGLRDGGKSLRTFTFAVCLFEHLINPGVVFVPLYFWDWLHIVAHLFLGQFALNIYSSLIATQC